MNHRVVNTGNMKWTPAKDEELLDLFSQGLTKEDVAREMGTSIASVEARYRKLKKEQSNGYHKS